MRTDTPTELDSLRAVWQQLDSAAATPRRAAPDFEGWERRAHHEHHHTVRSIAFATLFALLFALPAAASAKTQPYWQQGWHSIDDAIAITREIIHS